MAENSQTYTVDEAAALLGIGRNGAYLGVRLKQIPSIRIGKRILIPKAALDRMLARNADCVDSAASVPVAQPAG